jgi:hypothetical protein
MLDLKELDHRILSPVTQNYCLLPARSKKTYIRVIATQKRLKNFINKLLNRSLHGSSLFTLVVKFLQTKSYDGAIGTEMLEVIWIVLKKVFHEQCSDIVSTLSCCSIGMDSLMIIVPKLRSWTFRYWAVRATDVRDNGARQWFETHWGMAQCLFLLKPK